MLGLPQGLWCSGTFWSYLESLGEKLGFWSSSACPFLGTLSNVGTEAGYYSYLGVRITYGLDRGIPPQCAISLAGADDNVSEVERLILAEEQRLKLREKIPLKL